MKKIRIYGYVNTDWVYVYSNESNIFRGVNELPTSTLFNFTNIPSLSISVFNNIFVAYLIVIPDCDLGTYRLYFFATNDTTIDRQRDLLAILNVTVAASFVKGDFNYNGKLDVGDVAYVAYMLVGKIKPDLAADFNGNGRVDIGDLAKIAYYVLGKISEL